MDHNFITLVQFQAPSNQTNYNTIFLKLIYHKELDMLFGGRRGAASFLPIFTIKLGAFRQNWAKIGKHLKNIGNDIEQL